MKKPGWRLAFGFTLGLAWMVRAPFAVGDPMPLGSVGSNVRAIHNLTGSPSHRIVLATSGLVFARLCRQTDVVTLAPAGIR